MWPGVNGEVRLQVVVNQSPLELIEDAGGFHGLPAPLGVNVVQGQGGRTGNVQPVEFARHPQAGFIGIDHLRLTQVVGNGLIDRPHLLGDTGGGMADGILGQRLTIDIGEKLGGALQRQQIVTVEVGRLRFEAGAVLHRLTDLRGKRGGGGVPAGRAEFNLDLVFGHFNFERGQVEHLPLAMPADRHVF